ncbi:tail fiber assembly protein [Arsenophonus apicola]|uniref:Tail fiber assembly protein n=1 Tax=Arsenophonus apicola TaxID=2879119 RepID=A0ABY8P589_9GAMM|nr:tail fiber assembly protein [Arsenophonus apicola]WGO84668.1 tail fiber assembly protein [Arsenophonus apicola]
MKKYNLEIQQAEIRENGLAANTGWIKTYIADPITREYIHANMEYVYFDVSVSAGAYIDAPVLPTKTGYAVVRSQDETKWEIVADHRTKIAYNTETRQQLEIDFIGELPPTLTLLKPQTEFDKWNGKKWLTDTEAQKAASIAEVERQKSAMLNEANNIITYLQDAMDVGLASDTETARLQIWKKYRVLLNRINTLTAPDINWPPKPE